MKHFLLNKKLALFFFLLMTNLSYSKAITTAYLFPGQGSDERIFSKLKLDSSFHIVYINYPVPQKGTTLKEYARIISTQIDTNTNYIFIGMSLGGMICTELADLLKPQKVIIISSAKCRKELPLRYRFQKNIPINKIVPQRLIKFGAQLLQPVVEPDRNNNKETFRSMLKSKDPRYLKQTVNMIINWDRQNYNKRIVHIHGTNDHTIPLKNIKPDFTIKNGSHMMTLTKGDEINALILSILNAHT